MRSLSLVLMLCCATPALAQERTYNFQGFTLGEANIIARALEQGKLGETANVYFKMQRQISDQDQAASQSARAAAERDIRSKIEAEKPAEPAKQE